MRSSAARWFWSFVALQIVFLLGWAGYHEFVRSRAPAILLKTRPVDPRDLLRGDYMVLNYEIATVPVDGQKEVTRSDLLGKSVWVVLQKNGKYHEAVGASLKKPEAKEGQVVVRAEPNWRGLRFGIEQFYVPEGKGTPTFKTLEVEAAVSPTQQLYIRRLIVDGKTYP
jgi:uncharacterized membrane-anchored protein